MSTAVVLEISAEDAAFSFIAERYPTLDIDHLSVLRLGSNWLVEVEVSGGTEGNPAARVVLIVDSKGAVEETGAPVVSRHNVHRCLADLREVNTTLDLR